jgi:hypothetical protein
VLVPTLTANYRLLATAEDRLRAIPGSVSTVATDVDTALQRWRQVENTGAIDSQVRAANDVEAASRRLLVVVTDSPRVKADREATDALAVYLTNAKPPDARAFNSSVATYQAERRGPVRQVVANFVGGGDIPALAT